MNSLGVKLAPNTGRSWLGTLGGGFVGLLTAGPLGGIIGAGLGHQLDREVNGYMRAWLVEDSEAVRREKRQVRTTALFSLAGFLARVGKLSDATREGALDVLITQERLEPSQRAAARRLFADGLHPRFPDTAVTNQYRRCFHRRIDQLYGLLERLIFFIHWDAEPGVAQRRCLADIAHRLGVGDRLYRRFFDEVVAHSRGRPATASIDLAAAYGTLELDPEASDAEVKTAYRRQMSRHHPDKLQSRGAAPQEIAAAAARADRIRKAYDAVCRARGLN